MSPFPATLAVRGIGLVGSGIKRRLSALLAASALAAGALTPAAPASASASASANEVSAATVDVRAGGDGVTLNPNAVRAGQIKFNVRTTNAANGSDVLMFRPTGHSTIATVLADFRQAFSEVAETRARGMRDLTKHARFYGLAEVEPGNPASVAETLRSGTYYLLDSGSLRIGVPKLTLLRVHDAKRADEVTTETRKENSDAARRVLVSMTSADRFHAPSVLPAHGAVSVRNSSDALHEMKLFPVKVGTTDKAVQTWLDAGAKGDPPFFVAGPTVGLNLISPRRRVQLSYQLPAGAYLLFCEVPDDNTGRPHIFMGMHKVVALR